MEFPSILSVDGLGSEEIVKKWMDHFNHPPCVNDFGSFRTAPDPLAIRDFMMPPFSTKQETTGTLYINRRHSPSDGIPVGYTWYPDRIRRRCEWQGFQVETIARAAIRQPAALVLMTITNPGPEAKEAEIGVKLAGRAIHTIDGWATIGPEVKHMFGHPEAWRYEESLGAMVFSSEPEAFTVQGTSPKPDAVEGKALLYKIRLKPGESWQLRWVVALGESEQIAAERFQKLISNFDGQCQAIRENWESKIRTAFTPGNDLYSGHLPILHTDEKDLERLYYTTFAGSVLCCRRDNPLSTYGTAYVTLTPNYWTTASFLWDMMISATCWALIDPAVLSKMIEVWLAVDLGKYLATDYVTGKGLGYWYAVNDTAIVRMAHTYLRYTGDITWLDREIKGRKIIDHLEHHALRWHELDRNGHGLADCGGVFNLAECVSTWTHEVAAFNAMWVAALRQVAEMCRRRGESGRADDLAKDAEGLLKNVLALYADGKGYWRCRQPDGSHNDVRMIYDFFAVLESIPQELPEKMKREMIDYFHREHQTEGWIHALSSWDDDVQRDVRVDWQWTGSYPTFPIQAANGLYNIGHHEPTLQWLRKLSRIARQGPLGQGHWAEGIVEPFEGGAYKASPLVPYMCDWTIVSNGAYVGMFIESIFGAQATLSDGLQWRNQWGSFDANARLENLRYQGDNYRITRNGIERISQEYNPQT